MSRLAKKPIPLPQGVSAEKKANRWIFRGPHGEVSQELPSVVEIKQTDEGLMVSLSSHATSRNKWHRAMIGTAASLVRNAIEGAHKGFSKKLVIEGIGYKVQLEGKDLIFSLGFSHPVRITAPDGISFATQKNTITIEGADKALVGRSASFIRSQKPPEPYKGKGIFYAGEVIRRKAGKKAVGTT